MWSTTETGFAEICPCAHADCMTACIRCRVRFAVSAFVSFADASSDTADPPAKQLLLLDQTEDFVRRGDGHARQIVQSSKHGRAVAQTV